MNREPTMPDEDVVSAYLDGECTDAERVLVEEHLSTSADLRAALADVRAARDAVRALPTRDGPPEFWARLLAGDAALDTHDAADPIAESVAAMPVDLDARRRRPSRWLAAVGGAAAAAVIAALVLVPGPESVTPPVATFTDAHAVRSSLQDDAISSLVPLGVQGGFRR